MNFSKYIGYLWKKHPYLRATLLILILIICIFIPLLITQTSKHAPILYSFDPQIGSAGEEMNIHGKYFGEEQGNSYVEIGGNRITSSNYVLWTDDIIRVSIPQNINDGLLYVVTMNGKTNPKNFANKENIPVKVVSNTMVLKPTITGINTSSASVGSVLIIQGNNFGSVRNKSKVFFSSYEESDISQPVFISCSEDNFDYEYWSNQEIHVRIPDGTVSGNMYIETDTGNSNYKKINIDNTIGTKKYSSKKTYLLSMTADISKIEVSNESTITFRIPKPPVTASQRSIEVPVSIPEPTLEEFMHTIVHQFNFEKSKNTKYEISHSYVIPVYEIETSIISGNIIPYSESTKNIYSRYLQEDLLIPSNNEAIKETALEIIQNNTNPYTKAQKLFTWLIQNITIEQQLHSNDFSITDVLQTKTADAYELAILYTALLRSSGIPAIPIAGILVNSPMEAQNHWWVEFYLEKFGWVPVDIALSAGLENKTLEASKHSASWYFGNLDSQHITFSRGLNSIKQTQLNSKIVTRPKTYAFQTIWEEASNSVIRYSSFWSNIYVMGVY